MARAYGGTRSGASAAVWPERGSDRAEASGRSESAATHRGGRRGAPSATTG